MLDKPYDYQSIMHYGSYSFSKNNKPTIRGYGPNKDVTLGQREGFSKTDIFEVNALYDCSGNYYGTYHNSNNNSSMELVRFGRITEGILKASLMFCFIVGAIETIPYFSLQDRLMVGVRGVTLVLAMIPAKKSVTGSVLHLIRLLVLGPIFMGSKKIGRNALKLNAMVCLLNGIKS